MLRSSVSILAMVVAMGACAAGDVPATEGSVTIEQLSEVLDELGYEPIPSDDPAWTFRHWPRVQQFANDDGLALQPAEPEAICGWENNGGRRIVASQYSDAEEDPLLLLSVLVYGPNGDTAVVHGVAAHLNAVGLPGEYTGHIITAGVYCSQLVGARTAEDFAEWLRGWMDWVDTVRHHIATTSDLDQFQPEVDVQKTVIRVRAKPEAPTPSAAPAQQSASEQRINRVRPGMTKMQVFTLLGAGRRTARNVEAGGAIIELYEWEWEDGTAEVWFTGGIVHEATFLKL